MGMINSKKVIDTKTLMLTFACLIFLSADMWRYISFSNYSVSQETVTGMKLVASFLMFIVWSIKRVIPLKKIVIVVLVEGLLLFSSLGTSYHELMFIFIVIWFIQDGKIDKILDVCCFYILVTIFFTVAGTSIGFTQNLLLNFGGRYRKSFGFTSPVILPFLFYSVMSIQLYLHRNRRIWAFILCILGIIVGTMTDTRTMHFFVIGLYVWSIIAKKFEKISISKWFCLCPLICTGVSFFLIQLYEKGNALAIQLNKLLTYRLLFQSLALRDYKIGWVGSVLNTRYEIDNWFTVDNAYLYLLFVFGIVGYFIIVALYICLLYFSRKEHDIFLFGEVILYCIMFAFWNRITWLPESLIILILSKYLQQRRKSGNRLEEKCNMG